MNNVDTLARHSPLASRLNYLTAHRIAEMFYQGIIDAHGAQRHPALANCIVFSLAHISTTVNVSIYNSWMSVFENIYLVPKKSSLNTNLLRHISNPTRVFKARTRSNFQASIEEIKTLALASEMPVMLFDIGGYFAPYIEELSTLLGNRLLLVIEDTANGHFKYADTPFHLNSDRFKSVAFDTYKMAENVMVANIILGHLRTFIPEWSVYKPILVVGYGRIGRSFCFALRAMGAKKITVMDTDKARLFMASTEGFETLMPKQVENVTDQYDYCFSMSGQFGVTASVVNAMKHESHLLVVTSYDDEFSPSVKLAFEAGSGDSLEWAGKRINIVNRGHPINLSASAAFDARNLSLHFLFGRIFSAFLTSLGLSAQHDWEEQVYNDILSEIRPA
ncbi:hypothetical protein [Pseudomonas soli]|uniref:hypothetical protein n=1 Tax=Pseudomonas soli TaxID=1306993 RepID=UPI0015E877D6|nr:hypothetical protein [Pseudomonas soli]